jgi:hypothetical protein
MQIIGFHNGLFPFLEENNIAHKFTELLNIKG